MSQVLEEGINKNAWSTAKRSQVRPYVAEADFYEVAKV